MPDLFTADDSQDVEGWHFVRVAVERGLDQGGSGAGLTYKSREPLAVGRRVEVPLGRGNTTAAGIVIESGGVELAEGFDVGRIKPILHDAGSELPANLVELARWIATYYICPLGMVLASMMPAAVKQRTGLRRVTMIERVSSETGGAAVGEAGSVNLTPTLKPLWQTIKSMPSDLFPIAPADLMLALAAPTMRGINALVRLNLLREIEADDIHARGGVPTQSTIEQHVGEGTHTQNFPTPTAQQLSVIRGVASTLGRFQVHLLRGVTGSGKTEVYLRVLEEALRAKPDAGAIVLVPEIALTPQTAGRFIERFRDVGVAVLHSGLSASQRHKHWQSLASGQARVVVGARSAVFAPIRSLALVIVDEEHAGDYKQDQLPRYHGRDVAIKRAHSDACPVLLGSATPSLESWSNARSGKYTLWEMTQRVGGGSLPRVEVVDLADERKVRASLPRKKGESVSPMNHLIGPTLERAMHDTLSAGGQAILLLNRRGYACYIACAAGAQCGYVLGCEHCEARMIEHRVVAGKPPPKGLVRCHHCQAQTLMPTHCPQCGSRMLALGLGTQRVEEELLSKFAGVLDETSLLRVDGDTMGSARDYFSVLSRFATGELRVLLGTQMIAKGLDFPNVRLVGVINADTALSLPDFRAAERTFQLVSQVAGRAGRGVHEGRVIVQTMDTTAPAIVHAAAHDYVSFAEEELASRAAAQLPPATRMARIVLRDQDHQKLQHTGKSLADALRRAIVRLALTQHTVTIHGPIPCPVSRVNTYHRDAIELTSTSRTALQDVLHAVRAQGLLKSDSHTAIDIDPIALM